MKAFYDSEADGLAIHFTNPIRGGYAEDLEGVEDMCWVEIDDHGEKVGSIFSERGSTCISSMPPLSSTISISTHSRQRPLRLLPHQCVT